MELINWSLQHKHDTAANWTSENPVLLAGQLGAESNAGVYNKFKIGDGVTAWNSLAYYGADITAALALKAPLANPNFTGSLTYKAIYSTSGVPTISLGPSAGTGATGQVLGNNSGGSIAITTGTTPSTNGIIATITLADGYSFPNGLTAVLFPSNDATCHEITKVFTADGTVNSFNIRCISEEALTALTPLIFIYITIGG